MERDINFLLRSSATTDGFGSVEMRAGDAACRSWPIAATQLQLCEKSVYICDP